METVRMCYREGPPLRLAPGGVVGPGDEVDIPVTSVEAYLALGWEVIETCGVEELPAEAAGQEDFYGDEPSD